MFRSALSAWSSKVTGVCVKEMAMTSALASSEQYYLHVRQLYWDIDVAGDRC
jgi:hypothetical protein